MHQYPADHPLWADVNFTPDWLYKGIQQEAAEASRARNTARASAPGGLGTKSQLHFSAAEDEIILYAHSTYGAADRMTLDAVDRILLRPVGSTEARWHSTLSHTARTLSAEELFVGQIFICLFVFVPQLAFPNACIATVFLYVGIILRQDLHIASYLLSATKILGAIVSGSTLAGVVLTLALLPPGAHLFWLCFFAFFGVAIASTIRAATDVGTGIVTGVIFGIVMVATPTQPLSAIWKVITEFYLVGLLAAAATLLSGCLVLPTMARNSLRSTVSQILTGLGASMSTFASHLFVPSEHADAACAKVTNAPADFPHAALPGFAMSTEDEQQAAAALCERETANESGRTERVAERDAELEHAESEGQPSVLSGAKNRKDSVASARDAPCMLERPARGELRSLMALHVYEHGVEKIQEVLTDYQEFLREASDPTKPSQPFHAGRPGKPRPISELRPIMLAARRLADESKLEPRWLANVPMCGPRWAIVLDAISSLLTRASALESVLEGSEPCLAEDDLKELLGHNVIPLLRLLYAQAAATCCALARALSCKCPKMQVGLRVLMEPSWAVLEFELASALHGVIKKYWKSQHIRRELIFRPMPQIRALLYVGALSNGILEALAHAERALTDAIITPVRLLRPPPPKVVPRHMHALRLPSVLERLSEMTASVRLPRRNSPIVEVHEDEYQEFSHGGSNGKAEEDTIKDAESMLAMEECLRKRTALKPLEEALHIGVDARSDSGSSTPGLRSAPVSFIRSKSQRPLRQVEAEREARDAAAVLAKKPVAGAGCEADTGTWTQRVRHRLVWTFDWAWPHVKEIASVLTVTTLYGITTHTLPNALRSRVALHKAVKGNRVFQYFLKYLTASSVMLLIILILQEMVPESREWKLQYAMATVGVVLSEKVDTTLSKGVLRILGTISGGVIGFGVMASVQLASNAWALASIVCLFTLLIGPITLTTYKYAAFLFVITLHTIILCQWTFAPGDTGSTLLFYARVTDIVLGVIIVLFFDLIFPWYTSTAAAETLGSAFCEATKLIAAYFEAFAEELQLAAGVSPHTVGIGAAKGAGEAALEEGAAKVAAGLAKLERDMLDKITVPLASVQVSLAREVVVWKHGILVLPPIIHDTVACMQVLHDRLAALEMMLLQKPIVSGRYSGCIHRRFMLPLRPYYDFTLRRAVELGEAIQAVLAEDAGLGELVAAETAIDKLQQSRVRLREAYLHVQHSANVEMAVGTDPYMRMRTPDDSIRYQSTIYALVRVLDKTVLLARTVLADEWIQAARTGRNWRHLRVWMGVSRNSNGAKKASKG
ncbi:hypothetical protein WJX81_002371 [Elliptochloris bilobata]|uniref:Integral membrane bound transporter domain-containing protein n=1 Tax=Elliptochloris bilobata TaxID=381761 RepID=A0AAW1RCJ8_9CHLO